jgi:hypothetical protein
MKVLGSALIVMVIAGVLGVIALDRYVFPSYIHRYRLTIELDDAGQVRSGSGVIQVTWIGQPKFGEAPPWYSKIKGQAVFVDLQTRGAVLAVLAGGYPAGHVSVNPDVAALRAFAYELMPDKSPASQGVSTISPEALDALGRARAKKELGPTGLPRMVWLSNIDDPRSARLIDLRDLGGTIDPKLRFRRAEIELTDEPVTTDLSSHLPWLKTMLAAERRVPPIFKPGEFKLTGEVLNQGLEP